MTVEAKERTERAPVDEAVSSPIIFLLGPPGAGKSTLGLRACIELGIEFLDLGADPAPRTVVGDPRSDLERLALA